jgi:hypothetical protein
MTDETILSVDEHVAVDAVEPAAVDENAGTGIHDAIVEAPPVVETELAAVEPVYEPSEELDVLAEDFIKKIRSVESLTADSLREVYAWVKAEIKAVL